MHIKRGDIFLADLSPVVGSEQGGLRPVLIIQNDIGNRFSPTVIVAAITSHVMKTDMPTHIKIDHTITGLDKESIVLMEQLRTIDKRRLKNKLGSVPRVVMSQCEGALAISLGLVKTEEI